MSVSARLKDLAGNWIGKNRLWLSPNDSVRESDSTAFVGLAARGRFLTVAYTWVCEGELQEGFLLLGAEKDGPIKAVWVDSWHMSDVIMHCSGAEDDRGSISVVGHYAAPPGPDWGWRTVIDPTDGSRLRIVMYNVPPGGREELAVEAVYSRSR